MAERIEKACTAGERLILAPHVERFLEAKRGLETTLTALEQRSAGAWSFDPDRYVWISDAGDDAESSPPPEE